jgi:ABC-type transport system substrate-binding protein
VIEEVSVVDDDTVELTLSAPYEPLLQELSVNRPVRFLSPSSVGNDDAFSEPIGTGPWMFESSSETAATLVRFDDYWGDRSSIDQVDFSVIPDSQTRVSALQADEIDLIGGAYLAPISPVEAQALEDADEVELLEGDPDTTFLLGFNTDGPLGDQDVRDAVSLAIDLDALHEAAYAGFGEPASTLFPPTIPDHGTVPDHDFDPDAARELLDGERIEVELLASEAGLGGQTDSRTVSQAVAGALEDVGITVKINTVDGSTFFDEQAKGNYDLSFFTTFGAPYDPSSSVVSFLTDAESHPPFATSSDLDRLVDDALFAQGDDERADAYQAIYDELEQESAIVPITYLPRLYAVGPAVDGFEVPLTEYVLDLADVSVDR